VAASLVRFHPSILYRNRRDPSRLKAWGFLIPYRGLQNRPSWNRSPGHRPRPWSVAWPTRPFAPTSRAKEVKEIASELKGGPEDGEPSSTRQFHSIWSRYRPAATLASTILCGLRNFIAVA